MITVVTGLAPVTYTYTVEYPWNPPNVGSGIYFFTYHGYNRDDYSHEELGRLCLSQIIKPSLTVITVLPRLHRIPRSRLHHAHMYILHPCTNDLDPTLLSVEVDKN
jgi:hypothetical protein